jgi:hypothetical protein
MKPLSNLQYALFAVAITLMVVVAPMLAIADEHSFMAFAIMGGCLLAGLADSL